MFFFNSLTVSSTNLQVKPNWFVEMKIYLSYRLFLFILNDSVHIE